MTQRNKALEEKAACYGVSAIVTILITVFAALGVEYALFIGIIYAGTSVAIAEFLIEIPDKEGKDDDQ